MPPIRLEPRFNQLFIYAPDHTTYNALKSFLTFKRVKQVPNRLKRGQLKTAYDYEPCYKNASLPLTITCPIGFKDALLTSFKHREGFCLDETPELVQAKWITENTVPDWSRLNPNVVFRPQQRETLEIMCRSSRGRIVLPTGSGKSFMICRYIEIMPNARIIVCTYSNVVLCQLFENILKVCPTAGINCSAKKLRTDARVVCVSAGLLKTYLREDTGQDIDVLLVDEYYEMGAPTYVSLLERVQYAKIFGFAANKDRLDKAEFRLNGIFGKVLAELHYTEAVDNELVTPICVVWFPVRMDTDPIRDITMQVAKERFGIWRNTKRNCVIAEAARMFSPDDQVLISVTRIEHALQLREHLPEFEIVCGRSDIKDAAYTETIMDTNTVSPARSKLGRQNNTEIKKRFADGRLKKVIATGVWKRGVDFPALQVLIRADASNSSIADTQWVGRTSRKHDNKSISMVIDFTDEYSESFRRRAMARRKRYKEYGWKQMTIAELLDEKYDTNR
jgi:superfamily II DNA or RNA helicase